MRPNRGIIDFKKKSEPEPYPEPEPKPKPEPEPEPEPIPALPQTLEHDAELKWPSKRRFSRSKKFRFNVVPENKAFECPKLDLEMHGAWAQGHVFKREAPTK